MTTPIENLPLLTTIKVAGEVMGLTDDQVRGLLRGGGSGTSSSASAT
jgi:hypothetical protein